MAVVRGGRDDVDLSALERQFLLGEVNAALAPLLQLERDATDGSAGRRLWKPGGHLILGVGVVVGEGARGERVGGGVGGDGSVDGEVVDRHLLDLSMGKVEIQVGVELIGGAWHAESVEGRWVGGEDARGGNPSFCVRVDGEDAGEGVIYTRNQELRTPTEIHRR
jgi:hypothetical protein